MNLEDELDKLLGRKFREAELIAEKNKVLESKLIEQSKALEEKKRIIEKLQQKLDNKI